MNRALALCIILFCLVTTGAAIGWEVGYARVVCVGWMPTSGVLLATGIAVLAGLACWAVHKAIKFDNQH